MFFFVKVFRCHSLLVNKTQQRRGSERRLVWNTTKAKEGREHRGCKKRLPWFVLPNQGNVPAVKINCLILLSIVQPHWHYAGTICIPMQKMKKG